MIDIQNVCKKIDDTVIFDRLNLSIQDNGITGIVGVNGCGKTLLSRIIVGVYNIDSGSVLVDGMKVYENFKAKVKLIYLPEEPYVQNGATLDRLAATYRNIYDFDRESYITLKERFDLNGNEKLGTASTGRLFLMFMIVILSCRCKYVIIDDAIDKLSMNYRKSILETIKEYSKERAFVITTENTEMASESFDYVINMDDILMKDEKKEDKEQKS